MMTDTTHSAPPESFFEMWASSWNVFWFTPTAPQTLAVIRILTGLMTLYTLAVWTFEFSGFIGGDLLPTEYRQLLFRSPLELNSAWSHFDWLPGGLRLPAHVVGLVIVLLFTFGWQTRATAIVTALLVISYCNRAMGALFGLDQILAMLTLYLTLSNCGAAFSVDAWLKRRQESDAGDAPRKTVANGIATRLIQVHLCIVYLFAGLGKCQGDKWWDGEAIWGALASHEYQTIDMLWMSEHMGLVAVITMVSMFWEIGYVALIWPRLTRPIMLVLAIPMHLGIGLCLGMLEFGLIMLVANLAFVAPTWFMKKTQANN